MAANGPGAVAGPTAAPTVTLLICSGCGRCVSACPVRIITLTVAGFRKHAVIIRADHCTLCGNCITECPVAAISF